MLNTPGKLLEGQVCEIIDKHMENNKLITDKQWGFRKGRSTEGLLLQLTEEWKSQIDRGYVVGIIFINFRKAFDTLSHDVLFHKLLAAGISGNLHEWIVDYLSNRAQYTEVNGKASTVKEVKYIVLQGSLLGLRLSFC